MEIKLLDMLNDRSITFDDSIVDFISSTVIDKTMWHTQSSHWLFVYNRYARCLSLSTFIDRISIGHFHTSLCSHRSPIIYVLLWTSDCRLSSTRVGGLGESYAARGCILYAMHAHLHFESRKLLVLLSCHKRRIYL